MKFKLSILPALLVPVLIFSSCKKDPEPYQEPAVASRSAIAEVPEGLENNPDPNAQAAKSWINVVNELASFSQKFVVPTSAEVEYEKKSNVYFWSDSGISYWMTFSYDNDQYNWKFEYEVLNTNKILLIEASEDMDHKSGTWTIYNQVFNTQKVWEYNWSLNASNDYLATINFTGSAGYDLLRFEILVKTNASGHVILHHGTQKLTEVNWNADGSGSWWVYDLLLGSYSGTWN